ncbi:hypothetical protein SNOG_16574 [Parastagonospora nodorum SN15]|uniref:Uncharacterized protein n=1 Tax=Phaeosphaeria nodorum (strain SN15 / ATCC MYA-4574 / FGSC 10173) TaxID=321614 RepID=Q0TVA1_PHANO|nr:hypothetical protein SNOG_16574 [Parastagonospora nodorum SN15]EAT76054.1 hypothetical protein SNOG_16574 [Parastagonospora nodorum SN15]
MYPYRGNDAIYVFGGVRDLPYSRAEQWYDSALAKISLSKSWDYILDDSVITALGSHSVSDGPPPFLMYSTITYDSNGGIYIEGGARAIFNTTSNVSTTHPMPIGSPAENASWSLSKTDRFWKPLMRTITESSLFRTQILYTQAPDQNLIFYLNGILSNGSNERVYPKMTIINTRTNSSRTESLGTIHVFDIASLDDTPNAYRRKNTCFAALNVCSEHLISGQNKLPHISGLWSLPGSDPSRRMDIVTSAVPMDTGIHGYSAELWCDLPTRWQEADAYAWWHRSVFKLMR